MTPRRRFPRWLLLLVLVVMPLLELFVLVRVGQVIGAWWTILLLVAASIVGGLLLRREGARAWRAFAQALQSGKVPTSEIADGALIVLAGALMLAPGFVTDAFGLFLILPVTRPVARRGITALVGGRLLAGVPFPGGPSGYASGFPTGSHDARRPEPPTDGRVVRGDVVDP